MDTGFVDSRIHRCSGGGAFAADSLVQKWGVTLPLGSSIVVVHKGSTPARGGKGSLVIYSGGTS